MKLGFGLALTILRGDLLTDVLTLAVIVLVASVAVYLFLRRRQKISFREAIFNWPMVAVAGVVTLVLLFADFTFLDLRHYIF